MQFSEETDFYFESVTYSYVWSYGLGIFCLSTFFGGDLITFNIGKFMLMTTCLDKLLTSTNRNSFEHVELRRDRHEYHATHFSEFFRKRGIFLPILLLTLKEACTFPKTIYYVILLLTFLTISRYENNARLSRSA